MTSRSVVQIYRRFGETSWLLTATVDVCRVAHSSENSKTRAPTEARPKYPTATNETDWKSACQRMLSNEKRPRGHKKERYAAIFGKPDCDFPLLPRRFAKNSKDTSHPIRLQLVEASRQRNISPGHRGLRPGQFSPQPRKFTSPPLTQVAHIFSQSNIISHRMLHATCYKERAKYREKSKISS